MEKNIEDLVSEIKETISGIENLEFYEKKLQESIIIRQEINDTYWKRMNLVSKAFQEVVNVKHREFQIAKNCEYYQAGWPNENSKARLEGIVENFAMTVKILNYLGRTKKLDEYLSKYGIEVKINLPLYDKVDQEGKKSSEEANTLMSEALEVQAIICQKADTIKISNATEVKEKCKVQKGHFVKEVNVKAKALNGSDTKKDYDKLEAEIVSAEKILPRLNTQTVQNSKRGLII